jgi:hypothetical protein
MNDYELYHALSCVVNFSIEQAKLRDALSRADDLLATKAELTTAVARLT